ncbi:hypothetical protein [Bradyrhizobium sp. SYSU BS000235]|uniref:hypothetical protein n=1 Tax=Bradyrhizobium sp. SYSU BS000235 TaxID=3411332 RepID=UPI003C782D6A
MTLFLILAPFATFASLMMLTTVKISLLASTVIALGIFGWDLVKGRSIKMLSAGAVLLFAALCSYHMLATEISPTTARLIVDSGVLTIALGSIAIRLPFTLQYARERVDAQIQQQPRFLRVNYILTWAWSAAFVLMLAVDVLTIYLPSIPLWICAAVAFVARNTATFFTQWYPKHVRAAVAQQPHEPALAGAIQN